MRAPNPSVCLITCYYDTNYIRTTTLREALNLSSYEFIHVANSSKRVKRYIEVIIGLIKARLFDRPDIYLLTFRGYEILPIVRLITLGKPLVFDEFINPIELVVYEQKLVKNPILVAALRWGYRFWLKSVQAIITDTASHAKYSSDIMDIPLSKYEIIPVSTDEATFSMTKHLKAYPHGDKFKVFYYGSMLPLHGVEYVVEAMASLKEYSQIELLVVGGKDKAKQIIKSATDVGANIIHKEWIDYQDLPKAMQKADICLGGPFGDTIQSQFVITGKTYQQLSLGRPTIIGNNKESSIFTDKKNVIISDQGDAAMLAESILWAYRNQSELYKIGQNGRQLYSRQFSLSAQSKKLSELLTQFIED